jgi:hypothetical protein
VQLQLLTCGCARPQRRPATAHPHSGRKASSPAPSTPASDGKLRRGTSAKDRVMVAVRKRPARETEQDIVGTAGDRIMEVCGAAQPTPRPPAPSAQRLSRPPAQVAEPRTKVDLTKFTEVHSFEVQSASRALTCALARALACAAR